jgi:hypothetical protein
MALGFRRVAMGLTTAVLRLLFLRLTALHEKKRAIDLATLYCIRNRCFSKGGRNAPVEAVQPVLMLDEILKL